MQAQDELPKEISYTPQNGTDTQEQEVFPKAASYASRNNAEEQEQAKSPYIQSPISHYNHDPHTEKPVGQMSANANTDDSPTPTPIPVKTIYDRFDKQEEFPNEYLGFNHSSKRKAPPALVKGTLIQPGQARHAARVIKQQEDKRLSKAEDAKTDIHYDRLREQWSQVRGSNPYKCLTMKPSCFVYFAFKYIYIFYFFNSFKIYVLIIEFRYEYI
ncbi:hypothetical protein E3Q06_04399 [Wallemia mellicola]|nr:hypothetical protein E3Q21_04405 [Wallemia mellicola]TIC36664.1 hypothetical protein E3Q07_04404 [Wallemia mellicola]TIC43222.1 hypothetical protein E3Q06_04399 [Wallemia mellicola]